MEKGACVNLIILIWTILACLAVQSAVAKNSEFEKNGEHGKKDPLKCYQCNSEYDPNCDDPIDNYTLGTVICALKTRPEHLDRNITSTICRKTIQKVNGNKRVIRSCGYITDPHYDGECVRRTGTHDVHVIYCTCTGNLCNSGRALGSPQQPALAAFIAVLVATTRKCLA